MCPAFLAAARTAVVDHHSSNPGFAQINWVDGDAPATAVLVYRLLEAMGGALSREEAVCLYTGLSTDTGNFIYESTSAESFRMMATLMDAGLPLAEYARAAVPGQGTAFRKAAGGDAALPAPDLRGQGGRNHADRRSDGVKRAQRRDIPMVWWIMPSIWKG